MMMKMIADVLNYLLNSFEPHKAVILLRSFRSWIHRPRGRYARRFRLRLPRWLYRINSAVVDTLVVVGGAALMAGIWYICWT